MELKDLVGKHTLDAVDFSSFLDYDEDCMIMRFRLDGKTYVAKEDPEDRTCSSMKSIIISEDEITNTFSPVEVIGVYDEKGDDILRLVDSVTGEIVLMVGTEDPRGWYPGFIAVFNPENMVINR